MAVPADRRPGAAGGADNGAGLEVREKKSNLWLNQPIFADLWLNQPQTGPGTGRGPAKPVPMWLICHICCCVVIFQIIKFEV